MSLRPALFIGEMNNPQDGSVKTLGKILAHLDSEKIPFLVLSPTAPKQWPYIYGQFCKLKALPVLPYPDYHISFPWQKSFLKIIDAFRPTVIHIGTPCTTGHLARKYALSRRLPLLGIYHTHFISYFRYYHVPFLLPLGHFLMRRFFNSLDLLLVPTQAIMEELKFIGIHAPMRLWSRGINTSFFNPSFRSAAWRNAIADNGDPIVLYAGRLVSEKGLKVLAQAYRIVKKSHPHSAWVLAGGGPLEKTLKTQMPEAHFLGNVPHEKLRTVYASSDLFVSASATETFGNVVLEAMACGLPVVTSDQGGSAELSCQAYLNKDTQFAADSPQALADTLSRLLEQKNCRQQLAEQSVAFAGRQKWEPLLAQLVEHYKTLAT